ncbi:hypothetical protein E2562_013999 [Oryza meyeriana var. granulata]|uniref:Uncharacterized protein n=1 Tax=Oryza meyeriana var. granulata TaxID=110450 RepID=A0A6G1DIW2_9ORYZ|nr:hypothetical protein E2562_013999 [Oryza meyeriana var. granulata]
MIEYLNSVVAFGREHEGDEEYCKSLGFDERTDPDCWKKYFFAMMNETWEQQEADAAAHGAPCPEHEEGGRR